jgi:lipopolysaccharide transport system ATP-binding protein
MTQIIRVENLSKRYHTGSRLAGYTTLREKMAEMIGEPLKRLRNGNGSVAPANGTLKPASTVWALKDVSFEVNRGEVVGIVGRNGSGKSTLLKILSRITEPTRGSAELQGRCGSLLEVGTGFHPELTGRENIYLNGAILGMSRAEIKQCFDEIVAFAEVEPFLDTPVKRYSTGMYLRLAFAVAAHLRTEILFIDEVLGVGDTEFQRKCLGKIEDVTREGRTVMLVSHNLGAVTQMCRRALWLNEGRLELDGNSRDVVAGYFSRAYDAVRSWERPPSANGDDSEREILLRSVRLQQQGSETSGVVSFDQEFTAEIEYEVKRRVLDASIVLRIVTASGTIIFTSSDSDMQDRLRTNLRSEGRYLSVCRIPGKLLKSEKLFLTVGVRRQGIWIELYERLLMFEVSAIGNPLHPQRLGVITPMLDWNIGKLD